MNEQYLTIHSNNSTPFWMLLFGVYARENVAIELNEYMLAI